MEEVVDTLAYWSKSFEINGRGPIWQIIVSFCLCSALLIFLCWMNHMWDEGGQIYLDKILMNLSGSNIPSIPCPYSPLWATTPPAGQLWKVHAQKNGRILGLYSVKPRYLHYASSVYGPRVRVPMAQQIYLAIPGIYYKIHYTFLLLGCCNNWHSPKERRVFCLFVCLFCFIFGAQRQMPPSNKPCLIFPTFP